MCMGWDIKYNQIYENIKRVIIYRITRKIVTSGRLLYCQPEMVRPLTYLADKATNTCVGEYSTTLLFWCHEKCIEFGTNIKNRKEV